MPRSLLVLVICFVVSVGFAQSAKSSDTRPPLGHRDPGVNLAMGRWRFVTVMGVAVSPLSRSQPYLKFDERKHTVTGLTGCNRLRGTYEADGSTLSIHAAATTRMACPQDGYETRVLETMRKVTRFEIAAQELRLMDAHGVLAVLVRPYQEQTLSGRKP